MNISQIVTDELKNQTYTNVQNRVRKLPGMILNHMFNRQDLQLIDLLGEKNYIDTLIKDIAKINECSPDSKRWEYAYDCTSKRSDAAYFNVFFDNKDRDVLTKDCKKLNKLTMKPLEEDNMSIYEILNKINDEESLSEKYNVKNVKELKKLQESCKSREPLTEAMIQYEDLPRHIWTMLNDLGEESKIYNFSAVGQAITDNGGISDEQLKELQRIYDDRQAKWSSLNMWDDNSKERKFIVDTSAYEVMSLFGVEPNNQLPNDVMNIIYDAVQDEYSIGNPDATLWNEIEQKLRGIRYNKKAAKKYFADCLALGSDEYHDDFDDKESLKEDMQESSKSTKDLVDAAKQIITDLEGKGFVNADIASIGTMIKETIDSRYPGYVPPKDRLRKAFPNLNI